MMIFFAAVQNETAFETSLRRSVSARELTKLRTIARAGMLTFHFRYKFPDRTMRVIEVQ